MQMGRRLPASTAAASSLLLMRCCGDARIILSFPGRSFQCRYDSAAAVGLATTVTIGFASFPPLSLSLSPPAPADTGTPVAMSAMDQIRGLPLDVVEIV